MKKYLLLLLMCSLCQAQSPSGLNLQGVWVDCYYTKYFEATQLVEAQFCHSPIPTEYQPVTAMLDYVPGPGNPYEGVLIGFSSDGVGIGLKIHRPSWNQGLSLDLPDQKNVGVIIDIGPTSEGILMDCHYVNYWKFCYPPIPTEYQSVTAMLPATNAGGIDSKP